MALTTTQVYFNGNDLEAVIGASLIDHNFNDLPERQIRTYKLARANKSVTTSAEYSLKNVSVNFHLRGCTRAESEAVLADLKALLRSVSKELIVSQGGTDITYAGATLDSINYRWFSNKIILTLNFEVANPIGYEDSYTSMVNTNITSQTASTAVDVDGSFDALPLITLDYNSVTGGTGKLVTIKNEETGQALTIEQDFATSDSIEINVEQKTVVMNGATIDYTGIFLTFQPGTSAIGYLDTFTDRDVDLVVTYKKRYI